MNLIIKIVLILSFLVIAPIKGSMADTYTVGVVPQFDTRKINRIWRPILQQLEKETGHKFVLRGSPTISAFEKEFNAGKFDFSYMNPYHVLHANKKRGYIPLVRDNGRKLFGVVVVKKDSGITKVEELDGKTVAFPAPNALAASLMPRADFKNKFHINIKPSYVKTHSSVYLNVLLATADAGGGVQKTLGQQKDDIKNNLKIIYSTEKVAPHPFAAHPRVKSDVRSAVKNALLKLGTTDEGRALLSKIPMKKIGDASMQDYKPLEKMGLEKFYVED